MVDTITRPEVLFEPRGRWGHLPSIADRIDASGDCWEWTGYKGDGYGRVLGSQRVHRIVWEALVGPIPEGMTLDHLCRNRACCNPDHLRVVSRGENVLAGEHPLAKKARQKFCVRGHQLAGDNLGIEIRDGRQHRFCRECKNARRRKTDG